MTNLLFLTYQVALLPPFFIKNETIAQAQQVDRIGCQAIGHKQACLSI